MKFSLKNNLPAIVLSGTKRGKQIFFKEGVAGELSDIDAYVLDIRSSVQWDNVNLVFYGIEQGENFTSFSVYKTIRDWANRPGYCAVSLVIPKEKKLTSNTDIKSILDDMLKIYVDRYIEAQTYRIKEDAKESIEPFYAKLKEVILENTEFEQAFKQGDKKQFVYSHEDDLRKFFALHQGVAQGQVSLIPKKQKDIQVLVCSQEIIALPVIIIPKPKEEPPEEPTPPKGNVIIRCITVVDNENKVIKEAKCTFLPLPSFLAEELYDGLVVKPNSVLVIEKEGYQKRDLRAKEIEEQIDEKGLLKVVIEKEKIEPLPDDKGKKTVLNLILGVLSVILVLLAFSALFYFIYTSYIDVTKNNETDKKNDNPKEIKDTTKKEDNKDIDNKHDNLFILKKDIDSLRKIKNIRNIDKAYKEILQRAEKLQLDTQEIERLKKFGEFCVVIAEVYNEFNKNNAPDMQDKYVKLQGKLKNALNNETISESQKKLCLDYSMLIDAFALTGSFSASTCPNGLTKAKKLHEENRNMIVTINAYEENIRQLRKNNHIPQ